MKKSNKGFTLIELIIVIAILGIIAAIAIPKLTQIRYRAQVNSDVRTAEEIARMVRVWETDNAVSPDRVVKPELTALDDTHYKDKDLDSYIATDLQPESFVSADTKAGKYYISLASDGKIWVAIGDNAAAPTATTDPAEGATLYGNNVTKTRAVNYVGKKLNPTTQKEEYTAGWAAVVE